MWHLSAGAVAFVAAFGLIAGPSSAALPDGRAYELVSPRDKNGGDVMVDTTRTRAAVSGGAVQYSSLAVFADARGTGVATDYIARRDATPGTQGWTTHGITPLQDPLTALELEIFGFDVRYMMLSPDLSRGVYLSKTTLTQGSPNVDNVHNLYVRDDLLMPGAGHYSLISDCSAPPNGPCAAPLDGDPNEQPKPAGASVDFSHVIFESPENLALGATGSLPKLYEWDHGTVRLAGVLPDDACGSPPCPADSSAAGRGAGTDGNSGTYTPSTISQDGSRILFTSPVTSVSDGTPTSNLYLREDHTTTVQVNAPEPGIGGLQPATFWAATPNLSKIFFTVSGQLYMYDATLPASNDHNLTLLSVDEEPNGFGSGVFGVIGASTDGHYVYFVSNDQLVAGGSPDCNLSVSASVCIFLWHDGQIREVAHIRNTVELSRIIGDSPWPSSQQTARVTPDGKHLVFVSEGTPDEQPPYDHGTGCSGGNFVAFLNGNTPECAEVYVYDATANGGTGELDCASCNPLGVHQTVGDAQINFRYATAAQQTSYLNHPVSDDGRYVFFGTTESLVPQDTNNGVYDVYEYNTVTHHVSLLSGGKSNDNAFFLDASADGRDVFFRTSDRLSPWDTDDQEDLYDARIGGGFPPPPTPPSPCNGDGCRGPANPGPSFATPGTFIFHDSDSTHHVALFHALTLGGKQLRAWASTGAVTLRVEVSDGGRVSARVRGRVAGRTRLVAHANGIANAGGIVRLRLRLSRAARAQLHAHGRLRLSIDVGYARAEDRQRARVTLVAH